MFVFEQATGGDHFRRVDGVLPDVHVLNDALLVDNKRCPLSQLETATSYLFEANGHPILSQHFEVRISEEGKVNVELLRESCVCCRAVTANSENHRVACI